MVVSLISALFLLLSTAFSHVFCESVSLDGEWEMAYRPYEYASDCHRIPAFDGKKIKDAVPGYWEDLFKSGDAIGFGYESFRIQPLYHPQSFPISGTAADMTLPNIYGCFFYRKTVRLDREGSALLRFEGVRNQVHVWINGRFVAFRQGFSTPFELNIPSGILRRGDNEIVMAVSNNPNCGYCSFVSGLTTRSVFGGTGGVNGHLEISFPVSDISDVYVTTAEDLKSFTVHVTGNDTFDWEIPGVGKGSTSGDFNVSAEGLRLWSDTDPYMYQIRLTSQGKTECLNFGIRRLMAEGEKLLLNGRAVYLRGVTEHCYFPLTVHPPRNIDYYRMVTSRRKALGFNFVRFHTFVPPVEYLQACDEAGMLVHIESPNFVDIEEYEAIISFARSHPSVVIFCTGNETRIDAVAEAYLEQVADRVHTMSDALFSPMSALRGMEYILIPGHDSIVTTPWPHNPERFSRVGRYADVYTTYQNSSTSYKAINSPLSAADVDSRGDVYGKPRLAHEICIDGTYVDFSTETLYPEDSPIIKTGMFEGLRKMLSDKGILDRVEIYYRNSCEWQRRCRKFCFEKIRSMKRTSGYDFLGDINTHWHTFGYSVGMMDEFYRLKYSETVQNVLRYNSPAVLLCNLGSNFNFRCGQTVPVRFSLSNYDMDASAGTLKLTLKDKNGKVYLKEKEEGLSAPLGEVSELCDVTVHFPESKKALSCILCAEYTAGTMRVENEWEVWCFPEAVNPYAADESVTVVNDISRDDLLAAMSLGKTVVLFGVGPFKSLPATFQCGLPGRCSGNAATVIKAGHPALGNFPSEDFCSWQFRHLMEGAAAVQLEADVPFDPIIDVASAVKFPIRQSFLFEYKVGKGRLLVCSFNFTDDDPAALYLKSQILSYAASDKFVPFQSIEIGQLAAVIDHPLLDGGKNKNTASNVNDPSSIVRVPSPVIDKLVSRIDSMTISVETSPELIDEYALVSKKGFENSADMKELFLKVPLEDAEFAEMISCQNADGSFSDVVYEDSAPGVWKPAIHCFRIQRLAIRYRRTGDVAARDAALKAIDFWCTETPVCPNWWHNEIGCPRLLAPAFLLLKGEMSPEQKAGCIKVLEAAQICRTGQNRVWLSGVVLMRGLLSDDISLVKEARNAIVSEIGFGEPGAGVQKDWSFQQHGRQLQFGNYGLSYAVSLSWWAQALDGTELELSGQQITFLKDYVSKGLGQMVYKGMFDHNACGRQIFTNVQRGKALCTLLAASNLGVEMPEQPGGIYYPYSDYAVYRGDGWYASLRMQSRYVKGYECTNGENTQAYFSSDGALLTRSRGDEYNNIADVWNWKHIPGVTSWDDGGPVPVTEKCSDDENPVYNDAPHPICNMYGDRMAVGMQYKRDSLSAYKSWFFFRGGVICLAAGISCPRNVDVVTTVDQRLDIARDAVKYVPLKGTFIQGGGSLRELYIDHGRHPENASCAYAIIYGDGGKIKIVSNSNKRQAVKINGELMEIKWN